MRKLFKLIIAAVAGLIAVPAQADTTDTVLGVLSGLSAYGYNSCSYVPRGLPSVACQTSRATNVISTLRRLGDEDRYRDRLRADRQTQQISALQRACRAGDDISCQRAGGFTDNQATIVSALNEACINGDRLSCGRVRSMLDQRSGAMSSTVRPVSGERPASASSGALQFVLVNGKRCAAVAGAMKCFD